DGRRGITARCLTRCATVIRTNESTEPAASALRDADREVESPSTRADVGPDAREAKIGSQIQIRIQFSPRREVRSSRPCWISGRDHRGFWPKKAVLGGGFFNHSNRTHSHRCLGRNYIRETCQRSWRWDCRRSKQAGRGGTTCHRKAEGGKSSAANGASAAH